LAPAPEQFGQKNVIFVKLAWPTNYLCETEPKFQAPAPLSKSFWLGLHSPG